MKYGNTNFIQLQKKVFDCELSAGAFRLYCTLALLEHKYTDGKSGNDFFLRTDKQLAKDSYCSFNSVRKYKEELINAGLIEVGRGFYNYRDSGSRSPGICSYRIL